MKRTLEFSNTCNRGSDREIMENRRAHTKQGVPSERKRGERRENASIGARRRDSPMRVHWSIRSLGAAGAIVDACGGEISRHRVDFVSRGIGIPQDQAWSRIYREEKEGMLGKLTRERMRRGE